MLAEHRAAHGALATLSCVAVNDTRRYGAVELRADGSIARFVEKDQSSASGGLINGGVYLLSAQLLDSLTVATGSSLERDVLPHLRGGTLRSYLVGRANFFDIGTPESYTRAAAHIAAASAKTITVSNS